MEFICVTMMIIIGITDSRADQHGAGPAAPLLAVSGEDVILPCSLKHNTSAVNMRVEWFRLDLKGSVVHLYEDHEDKNTNQLQSYRGRTEVFKDELQKGNTSLKLSRVQISDEGLYKCFIQSKTWYGDITVHLRVEAAGSPPLITVDELDIFGGLRLQCESKGWYPEPELVWLDSEGVTLTSETTNTERETDGFRVKHIITVYNRDSKYHCRVKLTKLILETEIIISSKIFNSLRTSVILISCGAVLYSAITGILIAVFVHKKKELQIETKRLQSEERKIKNEHETLLLREKRTIGSEIPMLRKFAVNVTLDPDSTHPHLIVSDDGKQVRYEHKQPEKEKKEVQNNFDKELCVLGKEGFTSGCFYYEVQVKGLSVWFVGVARESVNRKGWILLNPENGYWAVGLRDRKYQACEEQYVPLSLSVKPQRVGVFVDYEEARVSFYDVESMCHIYTFTDQSFNEKLYPVFSLGYIWCKNSTPLIICRDLHEI